MTLPTMLRGLFLLAAMAFAGEAAAMRCGTRLVTTGDYDFQVRDRCGEPYWIASYGELLVTGAGGPVERRSEQIYDEWYYNFGPHRLVQRVVFRDGRVIRIDSLGYGRHRVGGDCSDIALGRGATPGEVVLRCGAPESRTARYQDILIRDRFGNEVIRPVRYEEWVYRFPGARFVRLAIFIDGRLDRLERVPL